jgi:hypothetical protein
MPWYRLYHIDPDSGHIKSAEEMFAADDVAATHDLQHRRYDHPIELWEEGRKVVYIEAATLLPPSPAPSLYSARGTRVAWRNQ